MHSRFYTKIFVDKWPSEAGGILLALLNTVLFLYSGPIAATNAVIAEWGRWFYKITSLHMLIPWHVLPVSKYFPESMLYVGLMSGVLLSVLFAGRFSLKREEKGGYVQGFIGGALMGTGSFLAGACILGGMYSDIMSLSLNGFVMMAGLLGGAFIGGKFMMWQISRKAAELFSIDCCGTEPVPKRDGIRENRRHLQPRIAAAGAIILFTVISLDLLVDSGFPVAAFVAGILAGVIIQRSAFCFAAAFREIFMTRTTRMMKSLVLSLLIGVTGFTLIKVAGLKPSESYFFHTSWRVLAGGVIFGFGMTIAGG
ncbi:MAG: hypothetical protein AMK71_02950 [Nitrospira bacterium SG8_35_4]|nr:MAG: hypothetical protein AMK71_02950 [Nitrospira bacterium SG8_35_4]